MLAQGPAEEMEKQLSLSCCAQAAVTSRGHTEEQCLWGIMPKHGAGSGGQMLKCSL